MKVGDAVIVKRIRHNLKGEILPALIHEEMVGVVTQSRRPPYSHEDDIEREWRVFTSDESHYWYAEHELSKSN